MVTLQQVEQGIIHYVETEIAQKAVGPTKFMAYFILPQIPKKVEQLFSQYKDSALFKDYLDENGNIHLDEVYNAAKTAIRKSGQIQMFGIIFNESDVDKLYSFIKGNN